jgi:uncharacterized protein YijF (DUF1287 family)
MKRIFLPVLLLLFTNAHAEPVLPLAQQLVNGANAQVGVTVRYDPEYRTIAYPGGDVPKDRGVCSDVIVRAYRSAGIDLQKRVHEDMKSHFDAYPHKWGLTHPDTNIDHRRVLNLAVFFTRHGKSFPVSHDAKDYLLGDIVTWRLPQGLAHIGMVSDKTAQGVPLMIHNIGEGAQSEDVLFAFAVTGHYRYLPKT